MQLYLKELISRFNPANPASLIKSIRPNIQELQNFHFYFSNPVFGLLILFFLLILTRTWGFKKAFSYCLLVSSILYLTTKIVIHTSLPIEGSTVTYADIIKFIVILIISAISIYYCFLKDS